VDCKQVEVVEFEEAHAAGKILQELGCRGWGYFGLDDELFARESREDFSELEFGGSVATGCFDVVDAEG